MVSEVYIDPKNWWKDLSAFMLWCFKSFRGLSWGLSTGPKRLRFIVRSGTRSRGGSSGPSLLPPGTPTRSGFWVGFGIRLLACFGFRV